MGSLYAIEQTPFFDKDSELEGPGCAMGNSTLTCGISLNDYGFIYIPNACKKGDKECDFHVHFHGCGESANWWDSLYVRQTGMLEWAATNDLMILFP